MGTSKPLRVPSSGTAVLCLASVVAGCGPSSPVVSVAAASGGPSAFLDYCRATMACEGSNTGAIHHVCVTAPIPFGMMLCEGTNTHAVDACVAATETFRAESEAYGCAAQFSALTQCLIARSVCVAGEYDQSACVSQMQGVTRCVNAASGAPVAVTSPDNAAGACPALATACAACASARLQVQCQPVVMLGDTGTCAQALVAIRQTCLSSAP